MSKSDCRGLKQRDYFCNFLTLCILRTTWESTSWSVLGPPYTFYEQHGAPSHPDIGYIEKDEVKLHNDILFISEILNWMLDKH